MNLSLSCATGRGPRFLTAIPSDGCSLLPEVEPFLEGAGIQLRPWQRDVLERALWVDDTGALVFRTVVVSTPRQVGKSWLLKAAAMVRCEFPNLFGGEPQTVSHVANKHLAARRIHTLAWGWAGQVGHTVRQASGMERIIWGDGSSWDVVTAATIYGASSSMIAVDEVWDFSGDDYREGLRPTQVSRQQPQLWAFSTAHRRATGLMPELMADGRAGRGRTLLADWGALEGDDFDDPKVWEAASPFWDAQRAEEMGMVAGTDGFAAQWLNVWDESAGGWISPRVWAGRVVDELPSRWLTAGIESAVGDDKRPVVARAQTTAQGVLVRVERVDTMQAAAALVRGCQRVFVGESLVRDPNLRGLPVQGATSTPVRAVTEFLRQFHEAPMWHDGGTELTEQVEGVRLTSSAAGGVRIISDGRVDGIKAAAWAVREARQTKRPIIVSAG